MLWTAYVPTSKTWAIVLAGGDGTRLRGLSRDEQGRPAPKQYCSFGTARSLLSHAHDRARRVASEQKTVTVVADHHRPWWQAEASRHSGTAVIQPLNRGTACGILLALWTVASREPEATVFVLPSDHFVDEEDVFSRSLHAALAHVRQCSEDIVLLGVVPQTTESEYGWIVPGASRGPGPRPVSCFVEKPSAERASLLREQGALWNTFVMAFRAATLLEIYARTQPHIAERFARHPWIDSRSSLTDLYADLPAADFSATVLESISERLRVERVPSCGWTDLGTPSRLWTWLRGRGIPATPSGLSRPLAAAS